MQVRRGFHRLGMFGVVPLAALATLCVVVSVHSGVTAPPEGTPIIKIGIGEYDPRGAALTDAINYAGYAIFFLLLSGLWYGICLAAGWVISGFRREG